jgi:hypothetical protein
LVTASVIGSNSRKRSEFSETIAWPSDRWDAGRASEQMRFGASAARHVLVGRCPRTMGDDREKVAVSVMLVGSRPECRHAVIVGARRLSRLDVEALFGDAHRHRRRDSRALHVLQR